MRSFPVPLDHPPVDHPPAGPANGVRRWLHLAAVALVAGTLTLGAPSVDPAQAKPRIATHTLDVKASSTPRVVERSDRREAAQRRGGLTLDRVVAETPETATATYQTIGVTWAADSAGTVPDIQVRTQLRSGGWSDWQTISDAEPIRTGNGRFATEPMWVGDATGVQVRVLGDRTSQPREVKATLLDTPAVAADTAPATAAAAASSDLYPRPPVVTRAGWGADESLRCTTPVIDATIAGVTVHHTAGSNSYTAAQSASIIRGIYAYHTQTLGWCDIGYNFLVDKFGTIFEGRAGGMDLPVHGAHATSWNTDTMGVSFMGNYETALPPAVMLEAGAKIIAWKLDAFQREAIGTVTLAGKTVNIIFGHGDVMATDCPGKNIRSQMNALRQNVAGKLGAHSAIHAAWLRRGGESGPLGSPHVAERIVGDGRVAGFSARGTDLYWHPSYGDHVVYGDIRLRYDAMGGTGNRLGWPTSDELDGPLPGSRMNTFTGGRIVWRGDTGAWPLWGEFGKVWDRLGEYQGHLGMPTSEEYPSSSRAGMVKQNFSGGRQYYEPATGAKAVFGAIGELYRALGEESAPVGVPRTSEYGVAGGRANDFSNGTLYYSDATGAHEVRGTIHARYRELGGPAGRLGFPTSDEYDVPIGRENTFQGGTMTWNRATGQVTVTYR